MKTIFISLLTLSIWIPPNSGAALDPSKTDPMAAARKASAESTTPVPRAPQPGNDTQEGRLFPPGLGLPPPPPIGFVPPPPPPPPPPPGGSSAFGPGGTAFHGLVPPPLGLVPLQVLDTQIDCQNTVMNLFFRMSVPFFGLIYPFNNFDKCILFAGRGETEVRLILSHDMCGAPPPPKKPGWSQLTDPVIEHRLMIQWEPDLVQEFDTSVVVRCDRPEDYNRTIKFNLDNVLDKNIISRFATHPGPQMWMEIQRGEGPRAKPLEGPVFLGETLTLVFTIADPAFWFDSNVLSCWASDGTAGQKAITWIDPTKPGPGRPFINQITVIENACSVKPKLFGHFQKVASEFPNDLTLTQWVYFQAFRFPTTSRVQIQCDIQVCFSKCLPMPPCAENYSPRSRSRRAAMVDGNITAENKNIHPEQLSLTRALEVLLREEEEPSGRILPGTISRQMVPAAADCITTSTFYGTVLGLALFIVLLLGLWAIYAQRMRQNK